MTSSALQDVFVDVVVPVYNTDERLVRRCVESVHVDDGRARVILVDDGSDERTASFLDSLSGDRVMVLHQRNGGQSAARLNGLRHAEASYVCFLDSDDWLEWGEFVRVLDLAAKHEPDLLSFEFTEIENGAQSPSRKGHAQEYACVDAREYVLSNIALWSVLYKRNVLVPSDFCIGPRMGEDIATAIPIALRVGRVATTSIDAYRYWRNADSMTRAPRRDVVTDAIDSMSFLAQRCSLLPGDHRDIVECLSVMHVLYKAGLRCVQWFGPDAKVKELLFSYIRSRYPGWRRNPLVWAQDVTRSPSFLLITLGRWRTYAALRKLRSS